MNLSQNLDWLISQWCERKASKPLRYILRAYPEPLVHTDQLGDLLEALRDIKGLCRDDLSQEELSRLISSINEVEDCLKQKS